MIADLLLGKTASGHSLVAGWWRLPPEIDFFGFYLTPVIVIMALALVLGVLTVWVADHFGLSRLVWHPPLFLLALIFIYGFAMAILFLPR